MVSRISIRFVGEKELIEESRRLVREYLEKKGYYVLENPRKEYEAAGEGNIRIYLNMAKRGYEKQ